MADPPWRLGERFDLLGVLGAGASGTVWHARETSDGAEHAVKLLRSELVTDEAVVTDLYTTLNAVARLGHPGIVAVDDAVVADGWLALRSRLVFGESLRTHLARQGSMPSAQVTPLIAQVCDALAAAHAAGIAHGALHAANVLLAFGSDGSPRTAMLTDFGMATLVNRAVAQDVANAPADVYAIGTLLYECMAGQAPFNTDPPPIAGITDSLWRTVAACLAEDPRYRPTAAQLAAALRSESAPDATQLLSVVPGLSMGAAETRAIKNDNDGGHGNGNGRLPGVIAAHKTESGIAAAVVVVGALIAFAISMGGGGAAANTAAADPATSAPSIVATSSTPQAIVLPSAPGPSASASPSPSASAPTTGDMVFVNTLTSKCMDTAGRIFADGTTEDIYDCNGTPAQTWTVTPDGRLTQNGSAYCLDDLGFGKTPGSKVALWSCNGGQNQQWTFHSDGSITGNYANLCLDVAGQASSDGSPLVLQTCDGSPSQQWSRH